MAGRRVRLSEIPDLTERNHVRAGRSLGVSIFFCAALSLVAAHALAEFPAVPGEVIESESTIGLSDIPVSEGGDEKDDLYDQAVAFVTETRKVSISSVQRKLRIGYNRAARLVETMEASGVVSPAAHNGSREVIAPPPM